MLITVLSLISLRNCTWGANSVPYAAVAIKHAPPGFLSSSTLITWHTPFTNSVPLPHTGGSSSTGSGTIHFPFINSSPGGHCIGSGTSSTHFPLTNFWPVGHVISSTTHFPLTNFWPVGHVIGLLSPPEMIPPSPPVNLNLISDFNPEKFAKTL